MRWEGWKEIKKIILKLTHHEAQTDSLSTVLKIQPLGTVLKYSHQFYRNAVFVIILMYLI